MPRPLLRLVLILASLAPGTAVGLGDEPRPAAHNPAKKLPAFTPEREAAARVFVQRHHPELLGVLDGLKGMNPAEYEKAIVELFQVSETLANLQTNDGDRFELALQSWKARSRIELLTAQLARTPSSELEAQLLQAVENQLAVEIRQHQFEREQARARLRRAEATLERLQGQRSELVESRYNALIKKARKARRGGAVTLKPAADVSTKGDRVK